MVLKQQYCLPQKQMQQMKTLILRDDPAGKLNIIDGFSQRLIPPDFNLSFHCHWMYHHKRYLILLSEKSILDYQRNLIISHLFRHLNAGSELVKTKSHFQIKNHPQRKLKLLFWQKSHTYKTNILFDTKFHVQSKPIILTNVGE